jgi:hypothetical protein
VDDIEALELLSSIDRPPGQTLRLNPLLFGLAWLLEDANVRDTWAMEDELLGAWDELYDNPSFVSWYSEHQQVLTETGTNNAIIFEERDELGWRRSRSGTVMLVPAHRLRDPAHRVDYFRELISVFAQRCADRASIDPPPLS